MKHVFINLVLWYIFGLLFLWVASFSVNQFTPFSYNLDLTKYEYQDVCVGDTTQAVVTARTTLPASGFEASLKGELFRYEDGVLVETLISRKADFLYQPNGGDEFVFEVSWENNAFDPPQPYVFDTPGIYAAGELLTIYPSQFVSKKQYFPPSQNLFEVVDCDHGYGE